MVVYITKKAFCVSTFSVNNDFSSARLQYGHRFSRDIPAHSESTETFHSALFVCITLQTVSFRCNRNRLSFAPVMSHDVKQNPMKAYISHINATTAEYVTKVSDR